MDSMPLRSLLLAAALSVAFSPRVALADVFAASILTDAADPTPADGICDVDPVAEGEQCTLRAAIQTANAVKGLDTVQLVAGTYVLSVKGPGEDLAASDDLDVTDLIEVLGQGAGVTILDAKKLKHRIFDVFAGLDLVGVTLQRGSLPKQADPSGGGCILSSGDLVVVNSVVTRCKSRGDGAGLSIEGGSGVLQDTLVSDNRSKDDGGGLEIDSADVLLDRVTISGNRAKADGGGLEVSTATLVIQNSTISGNRAKGGGGLLNEGGAVEIRSSTIAFNKAKTGAALSDVDGGTPAETLLQNSIVHAKKGTPCSGSFVSDGGNLESAASCGLALATDQSGLDPLLDELADNGGATPTHALLPGSPAIDVAIDAACPATDQRSQARVDIPGVGTTLCDSGAFEATP